MAACLAALGMSVLVAGGATGASGDLDAGFGGAGHGRVEVAGTGELYGVAVQENGGIIGTGRTADKQAVVFRLRPDGTRDTRFGRRILTAPGVDEGVGIAVAVQEDGKILVVGSVSSATVKADVAVWRLKPSGALDKSFGADGLAGFGVPDFDEYGFGVAVDGRGRVLIAGSTSNNDDMILVRFTADGTQDGSFNNIAGTPTPYFQIAGGGYDWAQDIGVQRDGNIVVTGRYEGPAGASVFRIVPGAGGAPARLDNTFDGDGRSEISELDPSARLMVRPTGAIFLGGETATSIPRAAVVRLDEAGHVESGFGSVKGVRIRVPDSTLAYTTALALAPGGGVVVSGVALVDGDERSFVSRLSAQGVLDQGMGPGGVRLFRRGDSAYGVAVQPDGRIVTAGTTRTDATTTSGVVYRLLGGLKRPNCGGTKATVVGTGHNDHLRGTGRADVIAGLGGRDTVKGLGKGDVVCGGPGRDRLYGGPGADRLIGGTGKDRLEGGPGRDVLRQ